MNIALNGTFWAHLKHHICKFFLCQTFGHHLSHQTKQHYTFIGYIQTNKKGSYSVKLKNLKRGYTNNSKLMTTYSFFYTTSRWIDFFPKQFATFPATFPDNNWPIWRPVIYQPGASTSPSNVQYFTLSLNNWRGPFKNSEGSPVTILAHQSF